MTRTVTPGSNCAGLYYVDVITPAGQELKIVGPAIADQVRVATDQYDHAREDERERLVALAADPQHLAQMGRDLHIGPRLVGLAQQALGLLAVAQAVLDPAQAVGDERVAGRQFQRLGDQLAGLGQALAPIG